MAAKKITCSFKKEKETKNKVRFAEVPEDGVDEAIGTLYMTKTAYSGLGTPESVTVDIQAQE